MLVSVVTTKDELHAIKDDWEELYVSSVSRNPFLSYAWVSSAIEHFFTSTKIHIVLIRSNQKKLLAVCPFIISQKKIGIFNVNVLQHFCSRAADFSDLLVRDGHSQRDLIKKMADSLSKVDFDLIHIDNLSSGSRQAKLLLKFIREGDFFSGSYINVVNPILEYDTHPYENKKDVKDIERRLRKLKNDSEVEFFIDQDITKEKWDELVKFHNYAHPNYGFNNQLYQEFYNQLLSNDNFTTENVDFSYMLIDHKMVAGHFGFKDATNGTLYYYVPSYDHEYIKLGVGKMLLNELINNYKDKGFKTFDFLRGAESYKKTWMTDELLNISLMGCKKKGTLKAKAIAFTWLLAKQCKAFLGR